MEETVYDIIIVGGGPAGLTTALYGGRAQLSVLLLEDSVPGGQMMNTATIENYPGFPEGITGSELSEHMEQGARAWGAQFVTARAVGFAGETGGTVRVKTEHGSFPGRTVVVAAGSRPRKLGVPGEEEYRGRGVSYCATCDGAFFRQKRLAVVGGGDSSLEEAIFLTRFAASVTIIHRRDELRGSRHLQERASKNDKIRFVLNSLVEEIRGDNSVRELRLKNVKTGATSSLACEGVFIYVGMDPNSEFLKGSLELDERGWVKTGEDLMTSLHGVFAAGDIRQKRLRQIVTAVSDGAIAAMSAEKFLSEGHA
ncbi:MAG: thioredoxin-disulfide reductase [Firmicutes bacterium]|nr:thioredoxin-disulfide reductase [Bacillota bacterium]